MINTDQAQGLLDGRAVVVGQDNEKIGKVGQIYLDDQTGQPEWATVKTGLFGNAESFVPLAQADARGSEVHVPHDKNKVKDAPRVDVDGALSQRQEAELYSYYGYTYTENRSDTGLPETSDSADSVSHDTSGSNTDDAMTRSEEQLRVGTERRESGRARLRKYVVTENVTKTVPVSHEEVRVEREPITDENRGEAVSGSNITDEEHEVILHEERPVVAKETVPVERVRMDAKTVTAEEKVTEEVRQERIETEGTKPSSDR